MVCVCVCVCNMNTIYEGAGRRLDMMLGLERTEGDVEICRIFLLAGGGCRPD